MDMQIFKDLGSRDIYRSTDLNTFLYLSAGLCSETTLPALSLELRGFRCS